MWVRNSGGTTPTSADFAAFAQGISNTWAALFLPHLTTTVVYEGLTALYYDATEIALGINIPDGRQGGHSTSDNISAGTALVVSWQVAQHYRGGHPRTYFCGFRSNDMQNSTDWTPSTISTWRSAANDFHANVNAGDHGAFSGPHLGTVSFVLRNQWRTPTIFRDYVPAGAVVDSRIDSMRRRLGPDR